MLETKELTHMSNDTTTQENAPTIFTYKEDPIEKIRYVEVSDSVRVDEVVVSREGPFKGLIIHNIRLANTGAAVEKYSEETTVGLINTRLGNLQYIKAINRLKAKLSEDKNSWPQEVARLTETNKVIFSIEDALEFVPGERELTLKQLGLLVNKANKDAYDQMNSGDVVKAKETMELAFQLMERMQKMNLDRLAQIQAAEA